MYIYIYIYILYIYYIHNTYLIQIRRPDDRPLRGGALLFTTDTITFPRPIVTFLLQKEQQTSTTIDLFDSDRFCSITDPPGEGGHEAPGADAEQQPLRQG